MANPLRNSSIFAHGVCHTPSNIQSVIRECNKKRYLVAYRNDIPGLTLQFDVLKIGDFTFAIGESLGEGAFGKVAVGYCLERGTYHAIKVQKCATVGEKRIESQALVSKLCGIGLRKGVYGPSYYKIFSASRSYARLLSYMALPLADRSLDKHLYSGKCKTVTEGRRVMRDILDDLVRLHVNGYVHMDLKADNILISETKANISDYGISERIGTPRAISPYSHSQYPHCSPELFRDTSMTGSSYLSVHPSYDIWGIGCITKMVATFTKDEFLMKMAYRCLRMNPLERPTASELLRMLPTSVRMRPFFAATTCIEETTGSDSPQVVGLEPVPPATAPMHTVPLSPKKFLTM